MDEVKDLISRSALLESIEGTDWYTIRYDGSVSDGAPCEEVAWYKATEIYAALEKAPTVEAEPVVHARWEFQNLSQIAPNCSNCGMQSIMGYPRCPYCGAHMDEEVAE